MKFNVRYIVSLIFVVFGAIAAILPDKSNSSIELNEKQLLQEMLLEANYISVDELSSQLIAGDPSIRVIDVRSTDTFKDPIPNSINIPMDSLFSETYLYAFDQYVFKNVIVSQGDRESAQVWMMMRQLGYSNNYLLKGGIDEWKKLILNPVHPPVTASQDAIDLYHKRVAAKQYFTGVETAPKIDMKIILPSGPRKKKRVQGGCS